jgi:hypothetical protein
MFVENVPRFTDHKTVIKPNLGTFQIVVSTDEAIKLMFEKLKFRQCF